MVERLVPDPFLKNENWAYLRINSLKYYTVCFYCTASWGLSKYIETKLQTTCFHIIKLFRKIKRSLELVFLLYFPHNFWRKIFLLLYFINWPNFIVWFPLHCEILDNMCIAIVCKPCCDIMIFEVNVIFLIKPFFLHNRRVVKKTEISCERKELLRWNKNHFLLFLKGFQSSK